MIRREPQVHLAGGRGTWLFFVLQAVFTSNNLLFASQPTMHAQSKTDCLYFEYSRIPLYYDIKYMNDIDFFAHARTMTIMSNLLI